MNSFFLTKKEVNDVPDHQKPNAGNDGNGKPVARVAYGCKSF